DSAALDRPPSPALSAPPRRSSPSAPHRSSVSSSVSLSAPSNTERRLLQLRHWSYFLGPLQKIVLAHATLKRITGSVPCWTCGVCFVASCSRWNLESAEARDSIDASERTSSDLVPCSSK